MNNWTYFIFPALLGLVAGVGHGVISHNQELPFSLTEQFLQSSVIEESVYQKNSV